MGIFDNLFGGNQPAPQQTSQQQPNINQQPAVPGQAPGPAPTQSGPNTQQNGDVTAFQHSNTQDPNAEPQSPLDKFNELFTIDPNKEKDKPQEPGKFFNVKKEELESTVRGLDFIPNDEAGKELLAKVQSGDMSALPSLLNMVVQNSYLQQTDLSRNLMEMLGSQVMQRMESTLPEKLRSYSSKTELANSNQMFKHAGARPMIEAISSQFQQKFPDASPKEIASMTDEYLQAFAASVGKGDEQNREGGNRSGQENKLDWQDFFSDRNPFS